MPNLILDLPSEITDKIFKEFLGFAGYRWSKTNELFIWRKLNKQDFSNDSFLFQDIKMLILPRSHFGIELELNVN